jgi:hypothetical protein
MQLLTLKKHDMGSLIVPTVQQPLLKTLVTQALKYLLVALALLRVDLGVSCSTEKPCGASVMNGRGSLLSLGSLLLSCPL